MDLDRIKRIKVLALIAMFSDDDLLEQLVLKGGSAIDLFHPSPGRASLDLDFSIDGDFRDDIASLRERFAGLLAETFQSEGLAVFDVRLKEYPPAEQAANPFWGGYALMFKLAELEKYREYERNRRTLPPHRAEAELEKLRNRLSIDVGPGQLKTFTIELSKHEYCAAKEEHELDGFLVYVNTPLAITCEKLRAICQQAPAYREQLQSRPGTARARDFFDIHHFSALYELDWKSAETTDLLRAMFAAKEVPLSLIGQICEFRDFHQQGFPSLRETVLPGRRLESFDFYFDFVLGVVAELEPLWNV